MTDPLNLSEYINTRAKHDPATGCLNWTGGTTGDGRPKGKHEGRTIYPRREQYKLRNRPIEPGAWVFVTCESAACLNPKHLAQGLLPALANYGRGPHWDTSQKTHCRNDHEYTPENTNTTKRGTRQCKTCNKERCKAYRNRQKMPTSPGNAP